MQVPPWQVSDEDLGTVARFLDGDGNGFVCLDELVAFCDGTLEQLRHDKRYNGRVYTTTSVWRCGPVRPTPPLFEPLSEGQAREWMREPKQEGCNPKDLCKRINSSESLMFKAAEQGRTDVCAWLYEHGAAESLEMPDYDGWYVRVHPHRARAKRCTFSPPHSFPPPPPPTTTPPSLTTPRPTPPTPPPPQGCRSISLVSTDTEPWPNGL